MSNFRKIFKINEDGSEKLIKMSKLRKGDRFRVGFDPRDRGFDPDKIYVAIGDAYIKDGIATVLVG